MQIQTANASVLAPQKWNTTSANKTSSEPFAITAQSVSVGTGSLTGTASGLLSSDTTAQMIQASTASQISQADQAYLQQIATDPNFASKQAQYLGTGVDPVKTNGPFSGTMTAADKASFAQFGYLGHPDAVQTERTSFYNGQIAQGIPPAQIYANVLKFNANLPQSYGDSLGTMPSGQWNASNQAQYEFLQQAIDQANSTSASSQIAPSTPSAVPASATATG